MDNSTVEGVSEMATNMQGSSAEELEAIEELHEKDARASRSGDFVTLRSLLTDDAVVIPPGATPVRGAAQLDASFHRMRQDMADTEVLEYELDVEEIKVLGDYAYEWGRIRGTMRNKSSTEIVSSSYSMMRILQKQPDGSWRVHRTIWNQE